MDLLATACCNPQKHTHNHEIPGDLLTVKVRSLHNVTQDNAYKHHDHHDGIGNTSQGILHIQEAFIDLPDQRMLSVVRYTF